MIAYSGETPGNTMKTNYLRTRWERKNKKSSGHDSLHIQGITFPSMVCPYFHTVQTNANSEILYWSNKVVLYPRGLAGHHFISECPGLHLRT